jgi:hypothetical protein
MENSRSLKDTILRAVALIGLILVLMLGAWGIILLAFNLPTIAGNVGNSIVSLFTHSPSAPSQGIGSLEVSAPASVRSGSSMVVSWAPIEDSGGQYAYTLSYECQTGVSMKAPTTNGQYQTVPCATQFNYVNASGKMTLIPALSGSNAQTVTVSVTATRIEDNSVVASGSASVNVAAGSASNANAGSTGNATGSSSNTGSNTGASQSGATYIPSGNTTNLYGSADLSVRILSVNSLSSVYGRTVVQFEVANAGTNVAPAGWTISATLPVGYLYTYNSQTQQALYPGDKIVYTLTYDRVNNTYNNQYPYDYGNQNQYCTLQYPNYNCPTYTYPNNQYPYGYQNPNQNYYNYFPYQAQYGVPQTCYRYDGYQNVPVTCTDGSGNVVYNNNVITITADPRNFVYDYNRANNTASTLSPVQYGY